MVDYQQLNTEIQTDPTSLGFFALVASGNDQGIANLLNQVNSSIAIERLTITGNEFLDGVTQTDYANLAAGSDDRAWVRTFAATDLINIKSANTRAIIAGIFPNGTQTRSNMLALQTRKGSRSEQLFGIGVGVSVTDVAIALGRGK